MAISRRAQLIDPSAIRQVFALAAKLKNPCNLSVGQPHFDTPLAVREAAIDAIRAGKNCYTPTEGIPELCEAIAQIYANRGIPQEAVFATAAVSGGFLLALMAVCDVGDEILVPDPGFYAWKDMPLAFGVKPVLLDTYPDFRFRAEVLERAITERTRALILASPSNPSGAVITEEELWTIAKIAERHNLWIFYDEIYEIYNYDRPHLDMCRYYPKTITLNGFSKSHSMTGWRIGTVVGPKQVIDAMLKLQQYVFVCPPAMAQWGALAALKTPTTAEVADYRRKRDYLLDQLSGAYEIVPPEGAFYLFPRVPRGLTGREFVLQALDHNLIMLPGMAFSARDTHFRISYANSDAQLQRGVEILLKLA
jgi:aspartate/methionine/tyrosine aminotransferase